MEKDGPPYSKAVGKDNVVHDFQNYRCPKSRCNAFIPLRVGAGYTNCLAHLKQCYGSMEFLVSQLRAAQAKAAEKGGNIRDHFEANCIDSRERSFLKWTNLVVKKNVPPSMIEDPVFRDALGLDKLSAKTFKEMLFELVILVEEAISKEMLATTSGGLMHDGWTCNGVHYLGLFGCYNVKRVEVENSKKIMKEYPVSTLLSVAPLAVVEEEGHDFVDLDDMDQDVSSNLREAIEFNAETHAEHYKNILRHYYGVDCGKWARFSLADNTSTNLKIARLLRIPHVGCKNHQFALDVNDYINNWGTGTTVIDQVHETMKSVKAKLKDAALLRRFTDLKPSLPNATRWSGKKEMT